MGGTRDWQWKSDEELRLAVKCQIESILFIKSQGIDVTVHEGTATLRGTVQDQDSIRSAIVDAYGAA
jgi:osmotically-inducible protein OsmY